MTTTPHPRTVEFPIAFSLGKIQEALDETHSYLAGYDVVKRRHVERMIVRILIVIRGGKAAPEAADELERMLVNYTKEFGGKE